MQNARNQILLIRVRPRMLFSKSCAKNIDQFPNKGTREGTLSTLQNVTVYNRHPVLVATSLSSKPIRYTTLPPNVKERTRDNANA